MSNSVDNPFSISTQGQKTTATTTSASTSTNTGAPSGGLESAQSISSAPKVSGSAGVADMIMPCRDCYNYYDYNNYNYDMFEATSYKTSMDDQGYYSYYTRGDYTLYQSYSYSGLSTSQSFDGSSG